MGAPRVAGDTGGVSPRAFGPYLLFDQIGRGGMAEIFLARVESELGTARRVVIKEVLARLSGDPAFSRLLVREAKLAARLSHRNIVQVFDLGREAGRLFIAMEYVEGYDLHQLLRKLTELQLPLPPEFAFFIVSELLEALDYAHRAIDERGTPLGMVHRDISPSNVLLSFEGEVKLCDFGIARAMDAASSSRVGEGHDESRIQRIGRAGKSAYMAPEHARGEDIDARSDLFAAGILLWELCAGRRLYRGNDLECLELAKRAEIPRLPPGRLLAQGRIQDLLDRALEPDPARRFQSAREMADALHEYTMETGMLASQLKLGGFLTSHLSAGRIAGRREREASAVLARNALHLEVGEVEPVSVPTNPPESEPVPASDPTTREPVRRSRGREALLVTAAGVVVAAAVAAAMLYASGLG